MFARQYLKVQEKRPTSKQTSAMSTMVRMTVAYATAPRKNWGYLTQTLVNYKVNYPHLRNKGIRINGWGEQGKEGHRESKSKGTERWTVEKASVWREDWEGKHGGRKASEGSCKSKSLVWDGNVGVMTRKGHTALTSYSAILLPWEGPQHLQLTLGC